MSFTCSIYLERWEIHKPGIRLLKATVRWPIKSRPIGSWSQTRKRTKAISAMWRVKDKVSSHTGLKPEEHDTLVCLICTSLIYISINMAIYRYIYLDKYISIYRYNSVELPVLHNFLQWRIFSSHSRTPSTVETCWGWNQQTSLFWLLSASN